MMLKSNRYDQLNAGSGELPLKNCVNFDLKVCHRGDKHTDVVGDIRHMPFKPESFKKIHCYHTIEHLTYPDAVAMLEDCHGLLQQGGQVIIEGPDVIKAINYYGDNHWELLSCLYRESEHLSGWTGEFVAGEMELQGFRRLKIMSGLAHAKPERDYQVVGMK